MTRRLPEAPRSTAPPPPGPDLLLYRCEAFSAWLSASACTAMRLAVKPAPLGRTGDWRPMPCYGCPGVVALRERRETPAPRRLAT